MEKPNENGRLAVGSEYVLNGRRCTVLGLNGDRLRLRFMEGPVAGTVIEMTMSGDASLR